MHCHEVDALSYGTTPFSLVSFLRCTYFSDEWCPLSLWVRIEAWVIWLDVFNTCFFWELSECVRHLVKDFIGTQRAWQVDRRGSYKASWPAFCRLFRHRGLWDIADVAWQLTLALRLNRAYQRGVSFVWEPTFLAFDLHVQPRPR